MYRSDAFYDELRTWARAIANSDQGFLPPTALARPGECERSVAAVQIASRRR